MTDSLNETAPEVKPRARRPRKKVEPEVSQQASEVEAERTDLDLLEGFFEEPATEKPSTADTEETQEVPLSARLKEAETTLEEARENYEESLRNVRELEAEAASSGTASAPGYWQAFAGRSGRLNVLSFFGLLFSFSFFPLGLLFSGFGLVNARAVPDDLIGRILGWAGLSISLVTATVVLVGLLLLPFRFILGGI